MQKSSISAQFVYYTKKEKNGKAPIYLRLTQNRKATFISTPFVIAGNEWSKDKNQVKSKNLQHKTINLWMRQRLAEISEILVLSPELSKEQLKELMTEKDINRDVDLIAVYNEFKLELIKEGHYDEARHADVVIKKLFSFTNSNEIPINSIDTKFVQGFQEFLHKELGNGPNTVNKEMQRFKRVLTHAKKQGSIQHIPFDDYKRLKRTKSRKAKLSLQQIEALEKLDLKTKSQLSLVRDAFLFCFYNGGLRFGDLCKLTWMDVRDGRLVYEMSKTGTFKDIPLLQKPLIIIAKYKKKKHSKNDALFPIIEDPLKLSKIEFNRNKSSKNVRFNKLLKELAKLAQIEESISFHVARHSFADYARREKIPITDIKNMLGHTSISITEDYLNELDKQSMDEGMNKLFGS